MVFRKVLISQEDCFEKVFQVLSALNVDYSSDRSAFRSILRGKSIAEMFPTSDFGERLFAAGYKLAPEDAFVYHQDALFHMARGTLDQASSLLGEALKLRPNDTTIWHSRAELFLKLADLCKTELEREHYLRQATTLAKDSKRGRLPESYSYHTLIKIGLCRLKAALSNKEFDPISASEIVKTIETELSEGLLEYPNDSFLLSAEADFARMLDDQQLMLDSLRKAFDANPKTSFLAIRLQPAALWRSVQT